MIPDRKVCGDCKIEKDLNSFNSYKKGGIKLRFICKRCALDKENMLRRKNAEKEGRIIKERRKDVSEEQKNIEMLLRCKKYRENNREKKKESARNWAARNRKNVIKNFYIRYHADPLFNITIKIRRRIWVALDKARKGTRKADTSIKLLGCDYNEFKNYIESQFTEGMSWALVLKSKIHIDHKKPCSKFNLLIPDEQRKCFHYTNLQPLWREDNLSKADKWEEV